uniref:FBA_2 domain-containing protein n=2 Tax=Caenorhabditis tropicalis TaxID=1561998 RepID=A0A1I7TY21_9PELO
MGNFLSPSTTSDKPIIFGAEWSWGRRDDKLKGNKTADQLEKLKTFLMNRSRTQSTKTITNRIEIDRMEFFIFEEEVNVQIYDKTQASSLTFPHRSDYTKTAPLIKTILEAVNLKELRIRSYDLFDYTKELAGVKAESKIGTLDIARASPEDHVFWLNLFKPDIIKLNAEEMEKLSFDRLLEIDNVTKAKLWQVVGVDRTDCATRIAKLWMDNKVESDQTFQFTAFEAGTVSHFRDAFYSNVVREERTFIRIETNNDKKHIVLELGADHGAYFSDVTALQFLRLMVIPADLKMEEEDLNSAEWIKLIDPEYDLDVIRIGGDDESSDESFTDPRSKFFFQKEEEEEENESNEDDEGN